MTSLCVVSSHWTAGGTEAIAALTLPVQHRAERLRRLKDQVGATEVLYLATCNRVEVLLVVPSHEPLEDELCDVVAQQLPLDPKKAAGVLRGQLEVRYGDLAVEHLFSVAAGLDAARAGETEIRSQMRRALSEAQELALGGPLTRDVVERALAAARRIHERAGLAPERASLAHVALDLLGEDEPVALLGVTPLIGTCAARLLRAGREGWVVNRTASKAQELIEELACELRARGQLREGGPVTLRAMSLDQFREEPPPVAALVTAVGATEPVLDRDALERLVERCPTRLRVLDLGVPQNIDAQVCPELGIEHVGMDRVNEHARQAALAQSQLIDVARRHLRRELNEYRRVVAGRTLAPVMIDLGAQARNTLREGVREIVACRLIDTGVADCELVDRWIERMAKKVSHVPFKGLRALAASHGPEAVASFLEAADPELAARYAEATRAEVHRAHGEPQNDAEASAPRGSETSAAS